MPGPPGPAQDSRRQRHPDPDRDQHRGKPIKIGSVLGAIAITPAGKTAYVAKDLSAGTGIRGGVVVPINTATNNTGKPVKVGIFPLDIAITP